MAASRWVRSHVFDVVLAVGLTLSTSVPAFATERHRFDVPIQAPYDAIRDFAAQANVQILVAGENVADRKLNAVSGQLSTEQGLKILLAQSGLKPEYVGDRSIALVAENATSVNVAQDAAAARAAAAAAAGHDSAGDEKKSLWSRFRIAQADVAQSAATADSEAPKPIAQATVEEIVVSARRREESQRDVPLSIVARSGSDLEAARINDLSQLERAVPGMIYGGLSITATPSIYLRGIGTAATSTGVDPSVGTAIDGVVTGRTSALGGNFSDVERIEVLRGPQGTLFGKNSSAGLINIVTKDPTETWTGNAGVGYGSYDEVRMSGTVSGPLVDDKLLARLTVYNDKRGGYIDNLATGKKVLNDEQQGARATFVYRPAEDTRLRLSLYGTNRDNDWSHSVVPAYQLGPLSLPNDLLLAPIAGRTNDKIWTSGPGGLHYDIKSWGSTLQWDQKLGEYSLTSISAYQWWYWLQTALDIGTTPGPYPYVVYSDYSDHTKQWSQEFRLASPIGPRLDYVAGLYYYNQSFPVTYHQLQNVSAVGKINSEGKARTDTLSYAAFGEANFHVSDDVTLIAGTRWTREKKELLAVGFAPVAGATGFQLSTGIAAGSPPSRTEGSITASNWSWRLGAQWKPSPTQMLYGTAARGFKGPGVDSLTGGGIISTVKPEVATTYEIGSKSAWLDRRLSADLAVFYSTLTNYQSAQNLVFNVPGGGTITQFILANAGKVRSKGAELELQAVPAESLSFSLTAAYTDAIFTDYRGAQCYVGQAQLGTGCVGFNPVNFAGGEQDLSGTRVPLTPKFSGTLSATYTMKLGNLPFDGFFRPDYSYRSSVQYSSSNAATNIEAGYGLLGATLGLRGKEGHTSFSVYGKNLTNKFHVSGLGILSPGGYGTITMQLAPDYQRIWGANFNYEF